MCGGRCLYVGKGGESGTRVANSPLRERKRTSPCHDLNRPLQTTILLRQAQITSNSNPRLHPLRSHPTIIRTNILYRLFHTSQPFPIHRTSLRILTVRYHASHYLSKNHPSSIQATPTSQVKASRTKGKVTKSNQFLRNRHRTMCTNNETGHHRRSSQRLMSSKIIPPKIKRGPYQDEVTRSRRPIRPPFSLRRAGRRLRSSHFRPKGDTEDHTQPGPPTPLHTLQRRPASNSIERKAQLCPRLYKASTCAPTKAYRASRQRVNYRAEGSNNTSPFRLPSQRYFRT